MKFFSTLVVLAQLAMFGSLVQATFPTDDILQYSTRELVEELQTRMILAKRTRGDIAGNSGPYRRSVLYDDFLEFTSRGGPTTPGAAAGGLDDTTGGTGADLTAVDSAGSSSGASSTSGMSSGGGTGSTVGGDGHSHHRGHRLRAGLSNIGKHVMSKVPALQAASLLLGSKTTTTVS